MICLKIRTFVVSATTNVVYTFDFLVLWFAWKFVPLWYQQQRALILFDVRNVVICLKIRTFVVSATTPVRKEMDELSLWFAWKFVPLWYQQQLVENIPRLLFSCDLLENSYLCGISNNEYQEFKARHRLWFAWKFVPLWYQQQRCRWWLIDSTQLWFAWKFVPLWYQQQPSV